MIKKYDIKNEMNEWSEITGDLIETEQPEMTNGPRGDLEYWAGKGTINGEEVYIIYEFNASDRPDELDNYDWDDVDHLSYINR